MDFILDYAAMTRKALENEPVNARYLSLSKLTSVVQSDQISYKFYQIWSQNITKSGHSRTSSSRRTILRRPRTTLRVRPRESPCRRWKNTRVISSRSLKRSRKRSVERTMINLLINLKLFKEFTEGLFQNRKKRWRKHWKSTTKSTSMRPLYQLKNRWNQ